MKDFSNSKVPGLFIAMKAKGVRAVDITNAIGVKSGNISDWKSGKAAPSQAVRTALANFLEVSVDFLENGTEDMLRESQKEKAPIESDEGGEESIKDYLHRLVDRMDDDGARDLLSHAEEIVLQRPKNLK